MQAQVPLAAACAQDLRQWGKLFNGQTPAMDNNEKYQKFIIEVKFDKNAYYSIWGQNSPPSNQNQLLINESGELLLFTSVNQLIDYIQQGGYCFDPKNAHKWVLSLDTNCKITSYNYPTLQNQLEKCNAFKDMSHQLVIDVVNGLNLIDDYATLTNSKELLKIIESDNACFNMLLEYSVFDVDFNLKDIDKKYSFESFKFSLCTLTDVMKKFITIVK